MKLKLNIHTYPDLLKDKKPYKVTLNVENGICTFEGFKFFSIETLKELKQQFLDMSNQITETIAEHEKLTKELLN